LASPGLGGWRRYALGPRIRDRRKGSDEGRELIPAALGISSLIPALLARSGDDETQIPGYRQGKAGGIGGLALEEGPQGLAGDGLVALDGGDDGIEGHVFLGIGPPPVFPAMPK